MGAEMDPDTLRELARDMRKAKTLMWKHIPDWAISAVEDHAGAWDDDILRADVYDINGQKAMQENKTLHKRLAECVRELNRVVEHFRDVDKLFVTVTAIIAARNTFVVDTSEVNKSDESSTSSTAQEISETKPEAGVGREEA